MTRIEKTVFISYRRKDISWALAVYQYLTSQRYDVFFDFSSIPSGDFEQIIVSNIRARAHFVLILTPTALDRCNEPNDWLRREIETAIDEKRNIIPVFFDGFNFNSPSVAERMTGKIAAIQRYNGLDIPSGYFLEAMERLSSRYLNVPLNAVIHPVSTEVRKVVKDEQVAANQALIQKSEDIKELVKPIEEKVQEQVRQPAHQGSQSFAAVVAGITDRLKARSPRFYGISGGILLLVVLSLLSLNTILKGPPANTDPTPTNAIVATSTVETRTATVAPTSTLTAEPPTPAPTLFQMPGAFKLVPFSMHDPRWKDDFVGNSTTETIDTWGNLLTSVAMLTAGFGYEETPKTVNEKMRAAGGYQGALFIPSVLPYVWPNISYNDMVASESTPAPISRIDASLVAGVPVIVQVDWKPDESGIQTHFVLVYARQGNDFLILDPDDEPGDLANQAFLLQRYGNGLTLAEAISTSLFFNGQ